MSRSRRTFLGSLLASTAFARPDPPVDVRNTELAHPKTHFALRTWPSRAEWEQRKHHLRRQILSSAGLFPMPRAHELRVRSVRQTRHDGFVTEVLLLETLPGYLVGATLYRPPDSTVRRPAVLIPHGHWKHGRIEHLPSYSVPALGINLALQGYVALTWDMVGFNDARQTGHSFNGWREQLWGFNPLGLQLWNSIRALDYLCTRSDVDPKRIGCTGASGGGTQTILLSAVDDRVAVSAPVNMISAHYQGADPCEEAPNLRLGTNNVEIASMAAPRPMLVVSCTGDWTRNTPEEEFPLIQSIYGLYSAAGKAANAHFEAEHNYDRHSREAVYAFFAQHLQQRSDLKPNDIEVGTLDTSELLAFNDAHPRPDDLLDYDALFEEWIALSRRQNQSTAVPLLREQLRQALACEWPAHVECRQWGEYLVLGRPQRGDRVSALWTSGRGAPVVLVHPEGKDAARTTTAFETLKRTGRPVLLIDAFQTGSAIADRDRGGRWYLSYNQSDDAHRAQDILTALRYAELRTGRKPALFGVEKAAVWCTFAAAVAPHSLSLTADLSDFGGTDEEMKKHFFVPAIQRAGGLAAAQRILR